MGEDDTSVRQGISAHGARVFCSSRWRDRGGSQFLFLQGSWGFIRGFMIRLSWGRFDGMRRPSLGRFRRALCLSQRQMAFCNASVGTSVYRRVDGQAPVWEEVYTDDTPYSFEQAGIRGLTAVPSPAGKGASLLFSHTNRIIRMDPEADYAATVELKIDALLEKAWRRSIRGRSIIAAYSDMVPVTDPATGQTVHLMGVQSKVNGGQTFGEWYPGAAYLIRYSDLSYRIKEANGQWKTRRSFSGGDTHDCVVAFFRGCGSLSLLWRF